jgi:hypothetical protein
MTRRQNVEAALRASQRALLGQQSKDLKSGPIPTYERDKFLWQGLLLRCLPFYTEDELLEIQRLLTIS